MKRLALILMFLTTAVARADGFVCTSVDEDLRVLIYNSSALSEDGSPTGAVMVLSDPYVNPGRKTIARFTREAGLLSNSNGVYSGFVDSTLADTGRGGERIAGTTLRHIQRVIFSIDFSYEAPVENGTVLAGEALFIKRNGEILQQDFDCIRSLPGLTRSTVERD